MHKISFKYLKPLSIVFVATYLIGLLIQFKWMFKKYDYLPFINTNSENPIELFYFRIFGFPIIIGLIGIIIAFVFSKLVLKTNLSYNKESIFKKIAYSFSVLILILFWPFFNYHSLYLILIILSFLIILFNLFNFEVRYYFNRIKKHFSISDTLNKKLINFFLITGFIIISFIFLQLLLSTTLFFFDIKINKSYSIISFIISIGITFLLSKIYYKEKIVFKGILITIFFTIIVLISIVISSYFYDLSWDGLWYHQDEIYFLAKGWNPLKGTVPNDLLISKNYTDYWIVDNYAKAAEIYEACIYSLFNKIEYAKCFNILFIFASIFTSLSILLKLNKFPFLLCLIISLLISINPVSLMQFSNFYIDGQLISAIICLLAILIHFYFHENSSKLPNLILKVFLLFIISIIVNIKFSGSVYAFIIISGFLIIYLIKKEFKFFLQLSVFFFLVFAFSFAYIGFHPYVKNTIEKHHPFYPLNEVRISDNHEIPANFADKNRFERTFLSYFSNSGFITSSESTKLKVPFDVEDTKNFADFDITIGGFGPLFNVLIILSLVSCILIYLNSNRSKYLFYILFIILLTVFIDSRTCFIARYSPQLFLIPIIILIYGLSIKNITINLISISSLIIFIINIYLVMSINLDSNISRNQFYKNKLGYLKGQSIDIALNSFEICKLHLDDYDVKYNLVSEDSLKCRLPFKLTCNVKFCCPNFYNENNVEYVIKTDFDSINLLTDIDPFEFKKFYIYSDSCITSEKSFSGNKALKLNSIISTGGNVRINNIKRGDKLIVEVKKLKNSSGSIVAANQHFWQSDTETIGSISEEWEELRMVIDIPYNYNTNEELLIYLECTNNESCIFDDLTIYKMR